MPHQPSETLKNRSFIGLILSQFLAAFNDQATHIVAIFFASDMLVRYLGVSFGLHYLAEKDVIMTVTACFISPFLLFSPIAGPIADRYSKRNILVAWKMAEVAIMGLVLIGFLLPHCESWNILGPRALGITSAIMVVLGVFLMGTHSAFFVPAKYGAMPELLHHSILSRGNGMLEGTSFTANILGTVFGGVMYGHLKSNLKNGVLTPGNEWVIGAILFLLAIIGAIGSFLIDYLPPASPDKKPSFMSNFRVLAKSRSLMVAVAGIAFFAFMTLFMRQVLLAKGEADKERIQQVADQKSIGSVDRLLGHKEPAPPENRVSTAEVNEPEGGLAALVEDASTATVHDSTELKVAILIGLVGFGVGIGCALAGVLSGKKLELGLVLIGAMLLVVTTAALAITVRSEKTQNSMLFCLIMIGTAAGIYIVPMYTMLQHRAPKGSKGNLVAMSNFINVAGGFLALVVFYGMTSVLERFFHLDIQSAQVKEHPELRAAFIEQLQKAPTLASVQFLGGSLITVAMILLLVFIRPDFLVRTLFWTRSFGRRQINPDGLHHIPEFGPLLIVTNGATADDCLQIASLTDRFARFVTWNGSSEKSSTMSGDSRLKIVRAVAQRFGIVSAKVSGTNADDLVATKTAIATLLAGHVYVVSIPDSDSQNGDSPNGNAQHAAWEHVNAIQKEFPVEVCAVYCDHAPSASTSTSVVGTANRSADSASETSRLRSIQTGDVLPTGSSSEAIKYELNKMANARALLRTGP